MLANPEVSVVVPTRNRWPLLSTTLRGALAQEAVDVEVVVVDDASTDETARRLAALYEPRMRVIRHERSRGPAGARNAGMRASRGEWISFLDDDDVWSPLKLRRQLDAAAVEGASFVYAAAIVLNEEGAVVDELELPDPRTLALDLLRRNVMPAGCSNVSVRAKLVRELNGFDEQLSQLADWDLWIKLAHRGRAAACRETLVGYREHRGNMLLADSRGVEDEYRYLVRKHQSLATGYGVEFDKLWFCRWLAWGHRQAGRRLRAARVELRAGITHRSSLEITSAIRSLAGDSVVSVVRRLRGRPHSERSAQDRATAEPAWLTLYR